MPQFNQKIAYITSRFPPIHTETYHVLDVQAFEEMGLDVTIFSRINMQGRKDIHDISHITSPIVNLPDRMVEDDPIYDQHLLAALDDYGKQPENLVAELQKDEKLKHYTEKILEAVKYYYALRSYKSGREQLANNLMQPQSPIQHGQHVMLFLQGLYLAYSMAMKDISIAYAQSFSRPAQNAHYASLLSEKPVYWITQGHNWDTLILNDEEIRYRFRHADSITAESAVARKAFERAGVDISKVPVVYRGIDTTFFTPPALIRSPQIRTHTIELVSVARATEKKGLTYLIQALYLLPEDLHVHLTYIGDGPILEQLKNQAQELCVNDRITFLGNVSSRNTVLDYLQNADIFVSSSITLDSTEAHIADDYGIIQDVTDGLQSAVLEAAATGLPIITTDAGGNKDFINDKNGLVVRERDPRAIADAIYELACNPEKREDLARQARADAVKSFDYKASREPLRAIFEQLIEQKEMPFQKNASCFSPLP